MRFSVTENTPGYLPESDPTYSLNFADALIHANSLFAELEDAGYELRESIEFDSEDYALFRFVRDRADEYADERVVEIVRLDDV